jgi:hypothetical protein
MRLNQPFLKLPKRFCAETIAREMRALPASAWIPHPNKIPGNDAAPLVTVGGSINNLFAGQMAPTEHLHECKYVMEIMADIGAVWGRSRFMGLAAGAVVPPHVDINHYWRTHLRIHIPVITTPAVRFTCGDESVHMAPGECWIFDSFRTHLVENGGPDRRVHLVLDTVGGDELWQLMEAANSGEETDASKLLRPGQADTSGLQFERVNVAKIMSPWEMRCHINFAAEQALPDPRKDAIFRRLERLVSAWAGAWARFGESQEGRPTYAGFLNAAAADLKELEASEVLMTNKTRLSDVIDHSIMVVALPVRSSGTNPVAEAPAPPPAAAGSIAAPAAAAPIAAPAITSPRFRSLLERPLFIVSSPRSGSTLLFETMLKAPDLYTIGTESHGLIEGMRRFHPASLGWSSNRLTEADVVPIAAEELSRRFYLSLSDRDGAKPEGRVRMLEKTPKNSLRIPFFANTYPDATFVYLHRDPRQTMSSMLEAWRDGGFRTYPALPGWTGLPWSLLLVPGWRELIGKPLPEIVARQWAITTETLIEDLSRLPAERVRTISYDAFLAAPQETMTRLCASLDIEWDRDLSAGLPLSRTTVSAPNPEKWRVNEHLINPVLPLVEAADAQAREFIASLQRMAVAAA